MTAFVLLIALCTQVTHAEETVSDAETVVNDLAMLSIVAAAKEGQSNVVDPEDEAPAPEATGGTPAIQDTFNIQDAVAGDVLEATTNPQVASSTEETMVPIPPPLPQATSTETHEVPVLGASTSTENGDEAVSQETDVVIPGPASLEVVDEDIVDEAIVNPDVVEEIQLLVPLPIEAIAQIPLVEEEEFSFALTGKNIPTTQKLLTSDGEVIDERVIHDAPELTIDDAGKMTVSGTCYDAYFVVLLYKEPEDYERDPRSYILNRAYECNGTFSYAVDNVPASLPDGTYYLLIGEQGEVGEWVPITSLTEVTINRQ